MKKENAVVDSPAQLVERAEARRKALLADAKALKANLPLKFLRQQAHFTTPASDLAMVHPAQLFACLLAFRAVYPKSEIDAEVRKIEAYEKAVQAELGATIIEGVMSDRATDRHARARLRKATALGIIDAARATALGIITESEAKELTSG